MNRDIRALIVLCVQGLLIIAITAAPYAEHGKYTWGFEPFAIHKYVGLVFNVVGFTLLIFCLMAMKSNFVVQARPKKEGDLVTTGVFAKTRNPIYLAGLLMTLGWSVSFWSIYGMIFSMALYQVLLIKISMEEKFLHEKFGEEYLAYKKTTPRLFPRLWSS